jgi:hypothetical protein
MSDFTTLMMLGLGLIVVTGILTLLVQVSIILFTLVKEISPTSKSFADNNTKPTYKPEDVKVNNITDKFQQKKLEVPELDPYAIAPNLTKPPKAAGDFGHKTEQK